MTDEEYALHYTDYDFSPSMMGINYGMYGTGDIDRTVPWEWFAPEDVITFMYAYQQGQAANTTAQMHAVATLQNVPTKNADGYSEINAEGRTYANDPYVVTGAGNALAYVPEKFRTQVSRAFQGNIQAETLTDDMIVYRYWGDKSAEMGSPWYSTNMYNSAQARSYLSLPAGNTAQNVTAFKIPAGTTILKGKAASMVGEVGFGNYATGGGQQIYEPDPSVAIPVR